MKPISYSSTGILHYFNDYALLFVDQSIVNFYLALIPKHYYVRPQREKAHITVVRKSIEQAKKGWGYRGGDELLFKYEPFVRTDDIYFWINVYSDDIGKVREQLGLSRYRDGFDCYHITLGNYK